MYWILSSYRNHILERILWSVLGGCHRKESSVKDTLGKSHKKVKFKLVSIFKLLFWLKKGTNLWAYKNCFTATRRWKFDVELCDVRIWNLNNQLSLCHFHKSHRWRAFSLHEQMLHIIQWYSFENSCGHICHIGMASFLHEQLKHVCSRHSFDSSFSHKCLIWMAFPLHELIVYDCSCHTFENSYSHTLQCAFTDKNIFDNSY